MTGKSLMSNSNVIWTYIGKVSSVQFEWLTGMELDLTDHDPTSVEPQSSNHALPDTMLQLYGHVTSIFHDVISLEPELDGRLDTVIDASTTTLKVELGGAEDAHVATERVVDVESDWREVAIFVEVKHHLNEVIMHRRRTLPSDPLIAKSSPFDAVNLMMPEISGTLLAVGQLTKTSDEASSCVNDRAVVSVVEKVELCTSTIPLPHVVCHQAVYRSHADIQSLHISTNALFRAHAVKPYSVDYLSLSCLPYIPCTNKGYDKTIHNFWHVRYAILSLTT